MTGTTAGARTAWRRHLPFLVVLLVGVFLRVAASLAYRPALLFPDSFGYLARAEDLRLSALRPGGYLVLLWPVEHLLHTRYAIPAIQHVLGLGVGVAGYAFLLRRGVPRWGATLAAVPVLLDPLQLVLEQYVLSDVLFEAFLVAACLCLLWRPRPRPGAVVAVGLLVAAATLTRGAGELLLAVFVAGLLCLRVSWRSLVAFLLAALLPIGLYAVAFHAQFGHYALQLSGPRFLYARLAPYVQCDKVDLPAYEKPLCPDVPLSQRWPIDWYMWHQHRAAQWHVVPPPGMTQRQVVKDFDLRVLRAEPLVYARSVGHHFLLGFSPSRHTDVPGSPAGRWLFHDGYWALRLLHRHHIVPPYSNAGTSTSPTATRLLTTYRAWLWTPGPLLAVLLLAGLAAVSGLGRARRSGHRIAVAVLLATCLVPLLTAAALSGFSWRYQLPQLPLLPMAGALGLTALLRGRSRGASRAEPPSGLPRRSR